MRLFLNNTAKLHLLLALAAPSTLFAQEVPAGNAADNETPDTLHVTPSSADDFFGYSKFRVGGYGEMYASFLNYGRNRFYGGTNNEDKRRVIAIPRAVIAADYRFNSHWALGMEIEFEAGGVGIEQELENTENGEYETELESGGEVALEQFHLTRHITSAFNIRVGHQVVGLGLTNAHHEPIFFFGTVRPEGETTIIPSTWHETGLAFFGSFGRGAASFDYEAMVVAGLNADGFGRDNWVGRGKQGLFEVDNFKSPGYFGRLDWNGVKGLRVGASVYYCDDVTANADKPYKYSKLDGAHLAIWSFDAQYRNPYVTLRANFFRGKLQNADGITAVTLSNLSNYQHGAARSVAEKAMAYGIEAGANLQNIFYPGRGPLFMPFLRYEYFNPQEEAAGKMIADVRCQVSKWVAGLNWFALPNLVVKADASSRRVGTDSPFGGSDYHHENEFTIGVAYVGWFFSK